MASKIEWCDDSWNPTTGCTKVTKECANCYAGTETHKKQFNKKTPKYQQGFDVFVEHEDALGKPLETKPPTTFFVNSMSDLFHKDATLDFIKKVFNVMHKTPHHTFQVLTKRHENLTKYADQLKWTDNIWMGVSVGINSSKVRIEHLVNCPAKHKFLSIEPLLERLDDLDLTGIDLVYLGGESGSNGRPMQKEWVDEIIETCKKQNVKFFFKQWGRPENNPDPNDPTINKLHPLHSKGGCLINGHMLRVNPCMKNFEVKYLKLFGDEYLVVENFNDLNVIWELSSYLPIVEKEIFKELKRDIRSNGVLDPILYIETPDKEKIVIEGHTRLKACIELNKADFPTKKINEKFTSLDEIKLWMAMHQAQRRNLTTAQKLQLAFHSKPTIEKLARENQKQGGREKSAFAFINEKIDTYESLSKIAGVGRKTTWCYSEIMANAPVNIKKQLNNGELSVKKAYSIVAQKYKPQKNKKEQSKNDHLEKKNIKFWLNTAGEAIEKLQKNEIDLIVKDLKTVEHIKINRKLRIGLVQNINEAFDPGIKSSPTHDEKSYTMEFFTIGVYNSTEDEFFKKLTKNGVDTLCDIRRRRGIRGSKYTFANSTKLQQKLHELKINYYHILELAPTDEIRNLQKKIDREKGQSARQGRELDKTFIDEYKKQMLDKFDFETFLENLAQDGAIRIVFLCVEESSKTCHRSFVTDRLKDKYNYKVRHL